MPKKLLAILLCLIILIFASACGKSDAAQTADDMIMSIGLITKESDPQISAAEAAVGNLSVREKRQLENLALLDSAREQYNQLFVDEVFEAIQNIGPITLNSGAKISAARQCYNELADELKPKVENYNALLNAESTLQNLLVGEVEKAISAIGKVTLHIEGKITTARNKYDNLDPSLQPLVENYAVLASAEKEIFDLKVTSLEDAIASLANITIHCGDRVSAVREKYDAADDTIKSSVKNYDLLVLAEEQYKSARIANVVSIIAELGTITINSENQIATAQKAYDELPAEWRSEVSNYSNLSKARATLAKLEAAEVIAMIDGLGNITLYSEKAINAAEEAYSLLKTTAKIQVHNYDDLVNARKQFEELKTSQILSRLRTSTDKVEGITWYESNQEPRYADIRSYIFPYIGQRNNYYWLRLRILYTSDEWLFFEKVTIWIDGEKYYKTFDYDEIQRDNDSGDVWEIADIAPSNADIAMLRKIVSSTETIIRFEGDDGRHDFTVTSSDKTGIADILDYYERVSGN